MSGGGLYWKKQTIDAHRGPTTSYKGLSGALPPPPKNLLWVHDEKTREWRLEPTEQEVIVEAVAVDGNAPSDFLEHKIQPTDTFQGICLRYKITPTELRRANFFSGSSLILAPNPLRIPNSGNVAVTEAVPVNRPTRDAQIQAVMRKCPDLARSEAKCFLELHDWDLNLAVADAREDYLAGQIDVKNGW
jgi:LysM repeat protein